MKFYLLGDMLKQGSIILRQKEAELFRALGLELYSAIEQKDINDKHSVTEEENNKLAERIVAKDSKAIRESNLIVAEVDNNNVGSCVEIGQITEFNWWHDNMFKLVEENDIDGIKAFLEKYPKKKVFFHTSDIRHTQLNEKGFRRSFSFNQYLVGACLALNKDGIKTFKEVFDDVVKLLPLSEDKMMALTQENGYFYVQPELYTNSEINVKFIKAILNWKDDIIKE